MTSTLLLISKGEQLQVEEKNLMNENQIINEVIMV